ncbi:hypothetical protein WJX72_004767 [[Myrmecia] bisecta]|uniref:Uncharacterized protein n=1 Tax=[Myrmecia] bisecta TaxID=41462 RepID=A0AAW1Q5K4_9CHLO
MTLEARVEEIAKTKLQDASRVLVFEEPGRVLYSTFEPSSSELQPIAALTDDREAAIRSGITVAGKHYEVHRHHPPLVYGRSAVPEPETSEGVAVCKTEQSVTGIPMHSVITYEMPNISARMVPLLVEFAKEALEPQ